MKKKTVGYMVCLGSLDAPASEFNKGQFWWGGNTVLLISTRLKTEQLIKESMETCGESKKYQYSIRRVVTDT